MQRGGAILGTLNRMVLGGWAVEVVGDAAFLTGTLGDFSAR